MNNTKKGVFVLAGIMALSLSSCAILLSINYTPYYAIYYKRQEFPGADYTRKVWSVEDEIRLMRGMRAMTSNEKRNAEIVNKYYLGGVLFEAGIGAKNHTTTTSNNPYQICLIAYVLPNKDTSITIKHISVNSPSGNDLSHLANIDLPVTISLEIYNTDSGKEYERLLYGSYRTESIFNFKKEPIIVKFVLEVSENDKHEVGTIIFEFVPVVRRGLFSWLR